jgi:hypothetical protein
MKKTSMMLCIIFIFIAFSYGNEKKLKVFILAGQSNMVGHGKVEMGLNPEYKKGEKGNKREVKGGIGSLRYLATSKKTAPKYKRLIDKNGKWIERDDVYIYSTTSDRNPKKGKLTVGFGKGSWFGPEFAFGHVVGDNIDAPILIIKTSWGGKDLFVDFRPPSSGDNALKKGREIGVYYNKMLNLIKSALANYKTDFPELKEYTAEVCGFGWHQGWNDGCNKDATAEYEKNMVNFIKDVRTTLEVKNLPFVIANTGQNGKGTKGTFSLLCEAQLNLENPKKYPYFVGTVKAIDTRPFKRDNDKSPSKFGYHWNHNGESHYLVGESMGLAMISLLNN